MLLRLLGDDHLTLSQDIRLLFSSRHQLVSTVLFELLFMNDYLPLMPAVSRDYNKLLLLLIIQQPWSALASGASLSYLFNLLLLDVRRMLG